MWKLLLFAFAAAQECVIEGDPLPTVLWNTTVNKTIFYVIQPEGSVKGMPVIAFMHGLTAQFEMYGPFMHRLAAQGYAIIFPFVVSPAADRHPWVTNTDGKFLAKAMQLAEDLSKDASSPLAGVDADTFAVMGHSMGATCTIKAAAHLLPKAKVAVVMHPGICGPFGPPPIPSTWMPAEFNTVTESMPVVMMSARNDGAFWPAPYTAPHEEGCFNKTVAETAHGAAFMIFTSDACAEDHKEPKGASWTDGGHDCVMKPGSPEQPWAMLALKLYLKDGGSQTDPCYEKLWTAKAGDTTDTVLIHPKRAETLVV